MALDQQWDGRLIDLNLPFNRIENELSEDDRLIDGKNAWVTLGGKLGKRPGTITVDNTTYDGRMDRFWIYETLETPPKVFLMASFYIVATSSWLMAYDRLDAGAPGWTSLGSTRQIDASTSAHEATSARGLFFVKGFPTSASGEKLGTVIFDGSGSSPNVRLWGLLGPTTPARISGAAPRITAAISDSDVSMTLSSAVGLPATPFDMQLEYELVTVTALVGPVATITRGQDGTLASFHAEGVVALYRDWDLSDHPVTVSLYWRYSYCYKSITGQLSNRAPVETNPDLMPSQTGPFIDLIPKFDVIGHADTTNIPTIVILRTTDGGGTFYQLKEITNTGAVTIEVEDTDLASGASSNVFQDPQPDSVLSGFNPAPTLTTNSPPPAVLAPLVTGVDTPAVCTPIVYYQGRVWYAIGQILFFSALEELPDGIPEESFPSGIRGNFFRFQYPIVNLEATTEGLYIFTYQDTSMLSGNNLETFSVQPLLNSIGAPYGHPRAKTTYEDSVIWLTHDYRIAQIRGDNVKILSDPLYTSIVDEVNAGSEVDIHYWADLEKAYIVVSTIRKDDPDLTKQFVYDIKKAGLINKDFWFVPWDIRCTAVASGRMNETTFQRRLLFFIWNNTADSLVVRFDSTGRTGTDSRPDDPETLMDFHFTTNLWEVPAGNHVNSLRKPGIIPGVYNFRVERSKFVNDEDPRTYYYADDLWTSPISTLPLAEPPARLQGPTYTKGYKTLVYPVNLCCHRFGLRLQKNQSSDLFEVQSLVIVWIPDSGSGM